jgi:hypothetical protein
MEKRACERIPVSLAAKLVSGGKSYAGIIGDLSKNSIYMRSVLTKTAIDFNPETTLELKFQPPSGETLNLHCEALWLHLYKTPSHGLTNSMCLRIIDPSPKYKEFLQTL